MPRNLLSSCPRTPPPPSATHATHASSPVLPHPPWLSRAMGPVQELGLDVISLGGAGGVVAGLVEELVQEGGLGGRRASGSRVYGSGYGVQGVARAWWRSWCGRVGGLGGFRVWGLGWRSWCRTVGLGFRGVWIEAWWSTWGRSWVRGWRVGAAGDGRRRLAAAGLAAWGQQAA